MGVDIRDWVREQRDREGWSNVQISRILGCDQSAVSRILSGDRGLSAVELLLLMEAVGLPSPIEPRREAHPETLAIMAVVEKLPERRRKKLLDYLAD